MQIYINAALARLRGGIIHVIYHNWQHDLAEFYETCAAVNRALDLDLAIIQDTPTRPKNDCVVMQYFAI